jgi:hypothetical protein
MSQFEQNVLAGFDARLACCTLLVVLSGATKLNAHEAGASLDASLSAIAFSGLDGTIDAASGPERTPPSADCFANHIYAQRTAANLYYVAVNVPETTADPDDTLVFYFDSNHNGGTGPDSMDSAIRLTNFPDGAGNQSPGTAEIYSGNGTNWVTPVAFPAVKYTRSGGRLVVELTVQLAGAPVGFAFLHASGTSVDPNQQDCDGAGVTDSPTWPPTIVFGAGGDPLALTNPTQFGDLGRRAPIVTFQPPLCCTSSDITFVQNLTPMVQPFSQDALVDIRAQVHNNDATFQAKNVKVQIRVHKFGTGGGVVFTTAPTDPEIASIGPSAAATTAAVQWTPETAMHGCIQAELQPPTEGGGNSLDDYSIGGGNTQAQFNIEVMCISKGMKKRLEFLTFNPDKGKAQTITLVMQQRLPRGLEGLTFDLEQPTRPLVPLEEINVALVVTAAANVATTDVPRQKVHVPPPAGRADAVPVVAKPGERLHLSSTGAVDIDAGGPAPSTGPDGTDVSNALSGQFLLSGESAARVGGALIGSFDGFETTFLVGSEATITVPEGSQGLRLAINDLVEGNADNTGRGYDVEAWSLPPLQRPIPVRTAESAAAAATDEPPFPEVTITATVTEEVTIAGKVYKIVRGLGAVTYQLLVTDMGAPPTEPKKPGYLVWLVLLILVAIVALFLLKKRKTA